MAGFWDWMSSLPTPGGFVQLQPWEDDLLVFGSCPWGLKMKNNKKRKLAVSNTLYIQSCAREPPSVLIPCVG